MTLNFHEVRLQQQQQQQQLQQRRALVDTTETSDECPNATLTTGDVDESRAMYVRRIVSEIIETERSYVRDLRQIIQVTKTCVCVCVCVCVWQETVHRLSAAGAR